MRFYNSLTQCNSSLLKKVFQADISLSTKNEFCWTSHVLSRLNGMTYADLKRQLVVTL